MFDELIAATKKVFILGFLFLIVIVLLFLSGLLKDIISEVSTILTIAAVIVIIIAFVYLNKSSGSGGQQ